MRVTIVVLFVFIVATLGVAPAAATVAFNDPTPTTDDRFGWPVALEGNNVLIGAPTHDNSNAVNDLGKAYLFDLSGNLLQTFNDPTPTGGDRFGISVALDGNNVLIGNLRDDTNGFNVGQAHLFDLNGNLLQTFDDPTPTTGDLFGSSLALDGNNVLIGAKRDDTLGTNVGQAHLFTLPTGDFDGDGYVNGSDFLMWQRGESPDPLSQSDLAAWEANYGIVAPLSATSAAVPDPTTSTLALAALCLAMSRRRIAAR